MTSRLTQALGRLMVVSMALALLSSVCLAQDEKEKQEGFVSIFDGKTLTGWTNATYLVEDGMLVCPEKGGGGKLVTEKEYDNFIFRFEFRLAPGGNNGVVIRGPVEGDAAYNGMEIQILDDYAKQYANLNPAQYCGSIYDVVPCKRGVLKQAGEWNSEEIMADGRHIKITLNDQVIVDANLDDITDPAVLKKHPGLQRTTGRIGFAGHGSRVELRNLRVKVLTKDVVAGPGEDNVPPEGFAAQFNGKDLSGWKGLVANPKGRAVMTPEKLAEEQEKVDQNMRAHWKVEDGALVFDGKGSHLCTAKDYGDFEMYVDWKIEAGGDSGIYLRGSPQVQIWENAAGSGGLYNNQKNPSKPLKNVDKPVGQWNTFHIKMIGEKVWVWVNDELVVDNVTMENYWERDKPIYSTGQIELQSHGSKLYFKNIYLKEIPR